jgi:hypothetical protein
MASIRFQYALVIALALLAAPGLAHADGGDRVAVGGDAVVVVGETVESVAAFGGNATIDGRVEGDVVSFGGDVQLGPNAEIEGSIASFGGHVEAAPGARFDPDSVQLEPLAVLEHLPSRPTGPGAWIEDVGRQVVAHGLLFLLALLLMGSAPERMGAMQFAIVRDPLRTGATGAIGYVASGLLILLLAITVLGIPVALALGLMLPIATYVGLAAAATVIGAALPIARWSDKPVARLAAGVAVLFFASIVPLLGTLLVIVAACVGFGALIRTRFQKSPPAELLLRGAGVDDGPYRSAAL